MMMDGESDGDDDDGHDGDDWVSDFQFSYFCLCWCYNDMIDHFALSISHLAMMSATFLLFPYTVSQSV